MEKIYDIAIIGESMSGKSTWISNLFQENITKQLKSICELNQEGQTKIPLYYFIETPHKNIFQIKSICWNLEALVKTLNEKVYSSSVQKLFNLLNIPTEVPRNFQEVLGNYFTSNEYQLYVQKLETIEFISDIVNNREVSELDIISYVEISVSANNDIWKVIQDYELDGVKIRDTRGFLDETEDKMKEFLEDIKKNNIEDAERNSQVEEIDPQAEYLQKLLDDRGICGVDACIFMSIANSNALSNKNNKEIYGPVIRNMLEKHPTFLTIRTDRLTELYVSEPNILYEDCIEKGENGTFIRMGNFFTGFYALRKLLKEYGLKDKSKNYHTNIARNHYKELLLPDIPSEDIINSMNIDMDKIYRNSVIGVFKEVLTGVQDYYRNIEEAKDCLKTLNRDYSKILKKLYDKEFDSSIFLPHNQNLGYSNSKFFYITRFLSRKVQGTYYGGMVGVYGGLTTWINGEGRVGRAAIDFLETAYRVRKALLLKIVGELEEEIKSYAKQIHKNDMDIQLEIESVKENMILKFTRDIESDFEHLSCTNRMIPRNYLKYAYDKTREELDINDTNIGKYIPELENYFNDERWKEDVFQMSVVKTMLWHLIYDSSEQYIKSEVQ